MLLRVLCASDPARLRVFGARFTGVVYPGDQLIVEMWLLRPDETENRFTCESYENERIQFDEVRFRVRVGGTTVLSDGRAVVNMWGLKHAWSENL